MNDFKLVVSVFGDSGTGKTCLTRTLAQKLTDERVCVVNADYYLEDRGRKGLAELSCDFALLESQLAQPIGTRCRCPDYDFVAFRRLSLHGPITFTLKPLILVEQMYPYPKADVFIHLDMPREEAVKRVLQRDPPEWEWRALLAAKWRDIPSVSGSDAVRSLPDKLVLDASLPVEDNVTVAMAYIDESGCRYSRGAGRGG